MSNNKETSRSLRSREHEWLGFVINNVQWTSEKLEEIQDKMWAMQKVLEACEQVYAEEVQHAKARADREPTPQ